MIIYNYLLMYLILNTLELHSLLMYSFRDDCPSTDNEKCKIIKRHKIAKTDRGN